MQETKTLIQHIIEDHGVFIPKDHASFTSDEELMDASPDILSDILYALDMYSEDFDENDYLEEDGFGL